MKGRFEESKGWKLPNNLYIKGIYSTMFVILKISVLPSLFSYSYLDRIGNLPLSLITCVNNLCIRFCPKFSATKDPAKFLLRVFQAMCCNPYLKMFVYESRMKKCELETSHIMYILYPHIICSYLQIYFSKAF